MEKIDYWTEIIVDTLDEMDIILDEHTVKALASNINIAHEDMSEQFNVPLAPSSAQQELDKTKRELYKLKSSLLSNSVVCRDCLGQGTIGKILCGNCDGKGVAR